MPYRVDKKGEYYYLYKLKEKIYANKRFHSRQSAINMAKVWMNYRRERPYVSGRYILSRHSSNK